MPQCNKVLVNNAEIETQKTIVMIVEIISIIVIVVYVLWKFHPPGWFGPSYAGTWQNTNFMGGAMVLNSDGKGFISGGFSLEWKVEGDHIVLTSDGKEPKMAELSDDSKSLIIHDRGEYFVFLRK